MNRNKNVVINIPSDGLEAAVIRRTDAPEDEYRENSRQYIAEFLDETVCGRMFFNVCYKRSIVHSNVADTYLYNIERDEMGKVIKTESCPCDISPLNGKFREMLKRNIDIVKMALDECKRRGAEGWFSVRMNDHHYPDDRGFNSTMGYDRAEELGVNGSRTYLDFTKDEVQEYYKAYITELCENYDIDGIELDFLRSCPIMSKVDASNMARINNFVKELREITKGVDEKIQLAARIYPSEEQCLNFGLDAAQWIADGLIDVLTVENWYIPTYYNIPVEAWRESIDKQNVKNHPYTLLCGTDWAVSCDRTPYFVRDMWISIEQFKGFVSGVYGRGADGIYIFNHFNINDEHQTMKNLGLYTCYIDENGIKTKKRVLKDKINGADSKETAETGMRTYVNTYAENTPYPIMVTNDKGFEFNLYTGTKPKKYTVVVGIDECESSQPLYVKLNGVEARQIEDVPKEKDFVFKKSETEWTFVEHVSETAFRVMQFEVNTDAVKDGFNQFEITAKEEDIIIRWIEIQAK